MGGSGGGGGGYDIDQLRQSIRNAERSADDSAYRSDVSRVLGDILADANDRDVETTQTHLDSIKQALDQEVDGFVDLLFGGSVSKQTYVEGISDADILVRINNTNLAKMTPEGVRDYFVERLSERLPGTKVEPDGFAVTIKYSDGDVQLVPVLRKAKSYLLPSDDLKRWSRTRPQAFTKALSDRNKECGGKVIPTIKLAKVLLTQLPEDRRPSGYHLESLAVEAFARYDGPRTHRPMLAHFFSSASKRVLTPIEDSTGQSRHVDDYLGAASSLERKVLADSLGRIARRIQNADSAQSVDQWKKLFGVDE